MKTLGIIGGIGPESTIDYYRSIIALYKQRTGQEYQPSILIQSINLKQMQEWFAADQWKEVTEYLLSNLHNLARGGADFAILAANTAHIVFDELTKQSPLSLISVVEVTCQAAKRQGLKRLGLIGTKYTMQAPFYPKAIEQVGLTLVIPNEAEIATIHNIYFNELLYNQFKPESCQSILCVIERLHQEQHIDGLILGGTELPLLLRGSTVVGVTYLDTTQLHVEAVVAEMLRYPQQPASSMKQ
jgi:aspartate racemase